MVFWNLFRKQCRNRAFLMAFLRIVWTALQTSLDINIFLSESLVNSLTYSVVIRCSYYTGLYDLVFSCLCAAALFSAISRFISGFKLASHDPCCFFFIFLVKLDNHGRSRKLEGNERMITTERTRMEISCIENSYNGYLQSVFIKFLNNWL